MTADASDVRRKSRTYDQVGSAQPKQEENTVGTSSSEDLGADRNVTTSEYE